MSKCNYWWVTRPKRKLNSIPEILSVFAGATLEHQWDGSRTLHVQFENDLEAAGLKRVGSRRDGGGSGGRTYAAWLRSLGLICEESTTKQVYLTLAGEAIIDGRSPVSVLRKQVLEYQFPSQFSLSVGVDERFRIKPFRFLLQLLLDDRISTLSTDEVGKIVITEAETEKDYEQIVDRILKYRNFGDEVLSDDFFDKYIPDVNPEAADPYQKLKDIANTMFNWLEYTQLVGRDTGIIFVPDENKNEVKKILSEKSSLIANPEDGEFFQRKYGIDPWHKKDTRNLLATKTITSRSIDVQKIKNAMIMLASKRPIKSIDSAVIDYVVEVTGADKVLVEDTLVSSYPHGLIGGFLANYYEMAFKGTEEAVEFEKATTELFSDVFGYQSIHLGQTGAKSAPDILLLSDSEGYQAIVDNKAYSRYSVTGDHHNRMVHNYIEKIRNYSESTYPIGFFLYVAGGFISTFDKQIASEVEESGVHGSGISVATFIKMIEMNAEKQYSHSEMRKMFSLDREIKLNDL
ncbi:AlwI family type II restriction endonuclease [Butyrivibrio sp. XBB1001]|uniref:AlwI family type II restriction endonuclease n=1 Tax=Butyrivibrio sp. XBB1001 TaxID=1280682 RepID=UPI0004217860|nr:AlwI family type II restriction endonuclease [Butyrivibrio sp. XBB1001]